MEKSVNLFKGFSVKTQFVDNLAEYDAIATTKAFDRLASIAQSAFVAKVNKKAAKAVEEKAKDSHELARLDGEKDAAYLERVAVLTDVTGVIEGLLNVISMTSVLIAERSAGNGLEEISDVMRADIEANVKNGKIHEFLDRLLSALADYEAEIPEVVQEIIDKGDVESRDFVTAYGNLLKIYRVARDKADAAIFGVQANKRAPRISKQ